jgi:hypothetical protein
VVATLSPSQQGMGYVVSAEIESVRLCTLGTEHAALENVQSHVGGIEPEYPQEQPHWCYHVDSVTRRACCTEDSPNQHPNPTAQESAQSVFLVPPL